MSLVYSRRKRARKHVRIQELTELRDALQQDVARLRDENELFKRVLKNTEEEPIDNSLGSSRHNHDFRRVRDDQRGEDPLPSRAASSAAVPEQRNDVDAPWAALRSHLHRHSEASSAPLLQMNSLQLPNRLRDLGTVSDCKPSARENQTNWQGQAMVSKLAHAAAPSSLPLSTVVNSTAYRDRALLVVHLGICGPDRGGNGIDEALAARLAVDPFVQQAFGTPPGPPNGELRRYLSIRTLADESRRSFLPSIVHGALPTVGGLPPVSAVSSQSLSDDLVVNVDWSGTPLPFHPTLPPRPSPVAGSSESLEASLYTALADWNARAARAPLSRDPFLAPSPSVLPSQSTPSSGVSPAESSTAFHSALAAALWHMPRRRGDQE